MPESRAGVEDGLLGLLSLLRGYLRMPWPHALAFVGERGGAKDERMDLVAVCRLLLGRQLGSEDRAFRGEADQPTPDLP